MRSNRRIPVLFLLVVVSACHQSHGALITAGELVVDLRAINLTSSSTTWTNMDNTGDTVGNFVTKGGGNLNVGNIGGITKTLFVDTTINNSVLSALNTPASLLGNSTRSVEVWVYPLSSSATSAAVGWGTSGNSFQSSFNYNTGGNGLFSGWNLDTGWNGSLPIGNWIYLAYTYDGTSLKGYTNGVQNKSVAFGPMATASAKMSVGGARAASADPFRGYIADVRVHTGALSASDVANNFSEGIHSTLPAITGLTNRTIIAGDNLPLSPTVAGFPQPALQWRSNNVALSGQTNASLVLANIQYSQNGTVFSLVATNLAGKVTNGMTLTVIVTPAISSLDNQAVTVGSTVNMNPTVTGVPVPALRWLRDGNTVSDGATGNGSTISGSTSSSLSIANAQAADSAVYSLVASNSAGIVTNGMTLTVSSTNVPPDITGPADQIIVQSSNADFSAAVSGLPLPALQWFENGTKLPGKTNSSLTILNVQYAQNGFVYSIVAGNAAGMASNSATLFVLVPPIISQQPTNISVVAGSPTVFTVNASGVPPVSYRWRKNGNPIANATNSSYTLPSAQGAENGALFSVVVSNSVSVVTSSNATLTVLSTMTGTLLPTNGAANISPDQQLRITFSATPRLGNAGKLVVRDAANDSVFATIDLSQFTTFSLWSATISNAAIRQVQGSSFYFEPIAIYGNEAWITLPPTNRFAYNKSYYVNCDANVFLDAASASFASITGTNTWRFSTKPSGPITPTASTGPTNISVAQDGAGDFATLQGSSDWIPQNNSLRRTITVLPGTYRDFTVFRQNRNNVTIVGAGAARGDVQIIHPYPAFSGVNDSGAGTLRLESSDISVRNLTLDNEVYITNNGVVFAGPINTVFTTGNRVIFDNILMKGGQDTLYANSGSAYYRRCEIWGSVDFIYGSSLSVFDQCDIVEIRNTGGPVTAPSTDDASPYGLIFLNCKFPRALIASGYPYDVNAGSTTFMRPWRQDGMTAIINCQMDNQISTKGWSEWVAAEGAKETTCRAREYGSTLIGGGAAPTVAQRQSAGAYWLNTYDPDYNAAAGDLPSDPDVAPGTGTGNRLPATVDPADYTLSAIFGSWQPSLTPIITAQPTNQSIAVNTSVTMTVIASGIPDPTYQWLKNGTNLIGETNAALDFASAQLADGGTYSVMVSNSVGSVVSSNALLTVNPVVNTTPTNLDMTISGATLQFHWPKDHIGWKLEYQVAPLDAGLGTNWTLIDKSDETNQLAIPINASNAATFFRLKYP